MAAIADAEAIADASAEAWAAAAALAAAFADAFASAAAFEFDDAIDSAMARESDLSSAISSCANATWDSSISTFSLVASTMAWAAAICWLTASTFADDSAATFSAAFILAVMASNLAAASDFAFSFASEIVLTFAIEDACDCELA